MKNKILAVLAITLLSVLAVEAQVAQGGTYKLDQAVIASGGGTSADATGNLYKLDGVIGEPIAGTTSSASTYSVKGGFLTSPAFASTAAAVSISGRVMTFNGAGLTNALVTLTDMNGKTRTILTRKFGSFRFDDLAAGEVYIVSVASRRYTFQSQVLSPSQNLADVNFTAQSPAGVF